MVAVSNDARASTVHLEEENFSERNSNAIIDDDVCYSSTRVAAGTGAAVRFGDLADRLGSSEGLYVATSTRDGRDAESAENSLSESSFWNRSRRLNLKSEGWVI
jgi:hypothetical protein